MEANISIDAVSSIVHLIILIVLFGYVFTLMCTTPGKSLIQQGALLLTFYGICTALGALTLPSVVNGWWKEIGKIALLVGWVMWILLAAKANDTRNTSS